MGDKPYVYWERLKGTEYLREIKKPPLWSAKSERHGICLLEKEVSAYSAVYRQAVSQGLLEPRPRGTNIETAPCATSTI
jgi:hypothetical protein